MRMDGALYQIRHVAIGKDCSSHSVNLAQTLMISCVSRTDSRAGVLEPTIVLCVRTIPST